MEKQFNRSWTRFHDDPRTFLLNQVPEVDYPEGLADLIELCRDRPPEVRLRAAGSHWALSEAAISDHSFVETHDPRNLMPAMDRTLLDVVPGCLHREVLQSMTSPACVDSRRERQAHLPALRRAGPRGRWLEPRDPGRSSGSTLQRAVGSRNPGKLRRADSGGRFLHRHARR